jgi:two-component system, response regulator PdtaR
MSAIAERLVVLVIEDDSLLRMDAVDIVRTAGYLVVEAGKADEAIAIPELRPDIHVVFTDVQIPGSMDGLKLAEFVKDRWPPIKLALSMTSCLQARRSNAASRPARSSARPT